MSENTGFFHPLLNFGWLPCHWLSCVLFLTVHIKPYKPLTPFISIIPVYSTVQNMIVYIGLTCFISLKSVCFLYIYTNKNSWFSIEKNQLVKILKQIRSLYEIVFKTSFSRECQPLRHFPFTPQINIMHINFVKKMTSRFQNL